MWPLFAQVTSDDVGIAEQINKSIDLNVEVINEAGASVKLKSFFASDVPVIVSPVYFTCKSTCNMQMNNLLSNLEKIDLKDGKGYQVLAISFDPNDSSLNLKYVKEKLLERSSNAQLKWHFLRASEISSKKIMAQLGFKYKRDSITNDWLHISTSVVLSPQGKITRYFYGMVYDSREFTLALVDAVKGKGTSLKNRVLWYCFDYNSHENRYELAFVHLLEVVVVLVISIILVILGKKYYFKRK